jgi:hypothetical protein
VFAADRVDTWVFYVGIALPVVCLGALVLWHAIAYLVRKTATQRRAVRESPEPPAPIANDPERLERTCAALIESLASTYLQLADCWQHKGDPQRAATALENLIQRCPDTPQARIARDRLAQARADANEA